MLFVSNKILSPFGSHADVGWNTMASLLPKSPLFILSHLCSGAILPGSFWMPGDGYTIYTHWGHWSINRYLSCSFTLTHSGSGKVTSYHKPQLLSLSHFPLYPHIIHFTVFNKLYYTFVFSKHFSTSHPTNKIIIIIPSPGIVIFINCVYVSLSAVLLNQGTIHIMCRRGEGLFKKISISVSPTGILLL